MTKPYCAGTNCPWKDQCDRYKTGIDPKKEVHISVVPFDFVKNKCGYFVPSAPDEAVEHAKNILNNADKNKN